MKHMGIKRILRSCFAGVLVLFSAGCSTQGSDAGIARTAGEGSSTDEAGIRKMIEIGEVTGDAESFETGSDSTASIVLDQDKTLYLDTDTKVDYIREDNQIRLILSEGRMLLDVREKLKEDESLTISTASMDTDITGTIVFAMDKPQDNGTRASTMGVLEGSAYVSYTDAGGRLANVPVGNKAVMQYEQDAAGTGNTAFTIAEITQDDTAGFIDELIRNNPDLSNRIQFRPSKGWDGDETYSASGDWTYDGTVTLVAQSASKTYDGMPLTRPSDVLIYGLPVGFSASAAASGTQTDAGTSENPIAKYVIYNAAGEDVTSHFTGISTVSGILTVTPAYITVWTGSASKVYDGTPLTNPQAGVIAGASGDPAAPSWRNSAWGTESITGRKELYCLSGTMMVQGTNPVTGETREMNLLAGQKLTLQISEGTDRSIDFSIENITEDEIPEGMLRIYAADPALLAQACKDAGWDQEKIQKRIGELPETDDEEEPQLLYNNVITQISIDSDITDYNGRALGGREVAFTSAAIDDSIRVKATGSRTFAGQSINTYGIDWGTANAANYILSEDLGTLTVYAKVDNKTDDPVQPENPPVNPNKPSTPDKPETQKVTITADSGSKVYDGEELIVETYTVTGLPKGYTCLASCSGSITDAGTVENKIVEYVIFDAKDNDVTSKFSVTTKDGTLTVEPKPVTITTDPAEKVYDGTPLTEPGYTVDSWAAGDSPAVSITGTITDAGDTPNTYSIEWGDVNPDNYTITDDIGTLKVSQVEIVLTSDNVCTVTGQAVQIEEYGLIVEVKNVDSSEYTVSSTEDNEWGISFSWGDRITVETLLSVDNAGYSIHPDYGVASGDADNYSIVTVDQEGNFSGEEEIDPVQIDRNNMTITFPAFGETYNLKNCTYGQAVVLCDELYSQYASESETEIQTQIRNAFKSKGWI